jgi:hypothetical protein
MRERIPQYGEKSINLFLSMDGRRRSRGRRGSRGSRDGQGSGVRGQEGDDRPGGRDGELFWGGRSRGVGATGRRPEEEAGGDGFGGVPSAGTGS